MIHSLEIKNFKSIKQKDFQLRNLNLLFGLNGMGKSSFIQSLLLFRQSDRFLHGDLKLNGYLVKLGNTKDALYQYSKQENLSFSIQFDGMEKMQLDYMYEMESDIFKLNREATELKSNTVLLNEQCLFSNNFQYLNANRGEPLSIHAKNYSSVVLSNDVGIHGEFTAHFIEVHGNADIYFENLLHKNSRTLDSVTNKEIINKSLINQINLWMSEISPGINVRTTSIPNTENVLLEFVYRQPNFGHTNRFKPTNVGFGISYVLPVVTAILAARPGELIIIENPESHIHPRGQAELGKLIALASMNDVQIIVEAHSDHILNGIRVAVRDNAELSKRVILFYFDKTISDTEQYSNIQDVQIDKHGELSNYPANLLDEWSNQLVKLI